MKRCSGCLQNLSLDNFHKKKDNILQHICKTCMAKWQKDYYNHGNRKIRLKRQSRVEYIQYVISYQRKRKKVDNFYKFTSNLRSAISRAFKNKGYSKRSKSHQLIGCDFICAKNWLEYTWFLNYGTEYEGQEVHIDHIIPCSHASSEEELIALQHISNLQYLTPEDNSSKSNKYFI